MTDNLWHPNGPLRWGFRIGSVALIAATWGGIASNDSPSFNSYGSSPSNVVSSVANAAVGLDDTYYLDWYWNLPDEQTATRQDLCADYLDNDMGYWLYGDPPFFHTDDPSKVLSFLKSNCVGDYAS